MGSEMCIRDSLGERHHVHPAEEEALSQQQPLRRDDEVGQRPFQDLPRQSEQQDGPQDPDDEDDRAVAVRDRVAQPARDGEPEQSPENRPDQHRWVLMNADYLALMRQKILID